MKHLYIIVFILFCSKAVFAAANKKQNSTALQPVNLAVSFEILGKEKSVLSTLTFDGPQKNLISGNVDNKTNFKCDCSGRFETVSIGIKQYLAAFLEFNCGENDQKVKSKVGRFLIPVTDYQSFFKIIFLHKDQPEAVLKIKELTL